MPKTDKGKWRQAFTGDGRVSPDKEMQRYYEGKELKGRNKRITK